MITQPKVRIPMNGRVLLVAYGFLEVTSSHLDSCPNTVVLGVGDAGLLICFVLLLWWSYGVVACCGRVLAENGGARFGVQKAH